MGGMVLGLFPGSTLLTHRTNFLPGDSLIAYTDGITEAVNAAGSEWSEDGLHFTLRVIGPGKADELMCRLRSQIADFTGGTPQGDDMTLLVLTSGLLPH